MQILIIYQQKNYHCIIMFSTKLIHLNIIPMWLALSVISQKILLKKVHLT
jgi:hypothetical protein